MPAEYAPHNSFDVEAGNNLAKGRAIQALAEGTASPEQQQMALKTIVEEIAGTYNLSYIPGPNSRATDFSEGKRFVGLQIVRLTQLNYARVKEIRDGEKQKGSSS